jgi:hypothetical protein
MVLASASQGRNFYINILTLAATDLLDANGAQATISNNVGGWQTGTIGNVVLRDMGKTVRIPANNATGSAQRVLRKVQRVDTACLTSSAFPVTNGFVGFNEGVGGASTDYESFYINITPAAASGNGTQPKFVRLGY